MNIYNSIPELKAYLRRQQADGKTIGFVPTMGYLHEGHLSLIRRSAAENDITVVSIFVNPAQFGPNEDFDRYPRNYDGDLKLSQEAGAAVIFYPAVKEMYPEGYKTYVEVSDITGILCGVSRPCFFKGVATIVAKLFNIVRPDRAYFGQKDAQQSIVIQRMAKDLDMDVSVIVCPTVREEDGLAMSSRNVYLEPEERSQALVLSQSLKLAEEMIRQGERNAPLILSKMKELISSKPLAEIDYVSIVDVSSMKETVEISGKTLIALAVKFGKTRLIDNIMLEVPHVS